MRVPANFNVCNIFVVLRIIVFLGEREKNHHHHHHQVVDVVVVIVFLGIFSAGLPPPPTPAPNSLKTRVDMHL